MTRYQKQLCVALPIALATFLGMYLTFPLVWIGAVLILPFMVSFCWTLGILAVMGIQSEFGKWLSEDDK